MKLFEALYIFDPYWEPTNSCDWIVYLLKRGLDEMGWTTDEGLSLKKVSLYYLLSIWAPWPNMGDYLCGWVS